MEDHKKSPAKRIIAEAKTRDADGRFVPTKTTDDRVAQTHPATIASYLASHTHEVRAQDDLLDVHVGNPLRRITELLQEIKKQKAFSFTLKGSLGVMGVFLTLSVFGIFGGGKLLCDKGIQTKMGTVRILSTTQSDGTDIPVISAIMQYLSPKPLYPRVVLISMNGDAVEIPHTSSADVSAYDRHVVLATGRYDACAQTLKVSSAEGVEKY